MPRSDQTDFEILVLEGPNRGETLALSGRSMPYRSGAGGSISFGTTQRIKTTYYPGNRVATQQIMGPVEAPTTINGVWKERYLGENGPIELVEVFQGLCDTGVQVQVSWQTLRYRGIVSSAIFRPGAPTGGLSDIAWDITFEWNRRGSPPRQKVGQTGQDTRTLLVEVADNVEGVSLSVENFADQANFFLGSEKIAFQPQLIELEDGINNLARPVTGLLSLAGQLGQLSSVPRSTAEEAISGADQINRVMGQVAQTIPGSFTGLTTDRDAGDIILLDALRKADVVDEAHAVILQNYDLRIRLEDLSRPSEYLERVVSDGEDLRGIALDEYGNADLWHRVAKYNGLLGSHIPAGLGLIRIPLTVTDTLDERVGV